MEEQSSLLIDRKLLLGLFIIGLLLGMAGLFIKYTKGTPITDVTTTISTENILFEVGVISFFAVWIVVIIDMFRNDIKKKALWLTGMFAFFFIVPVVYLLTIKKAHS